MSRREGSVYVGTGGWSYFNVPGDRLQAYSSRFNFVEVNSSFYRYLDPVIVASWRNRVPQGFLFAIRCHRDVTHRFKFGPHALDSYLKFGRSISALNADVLVFETPADFAPSESNLSNARNFFKKINVENLATAWEIRGEAWRTADPKKKLLILLSDFNITHSVDLSQENPIYTGEMVYSRLFGPSRDSSIHNRYEFDDEELSNINSKAKSAANKGKRVALTFHGIRMYHDAARLKKYSETGRFPKATSRTGPQSVEEVVRQEVTFPATKIEMMEKAGWRLVDWTEEKRIRASHFLKLIEEKRYETVKDAVRSIMAKLA